MSKLLIKAIAVFDFPKCKGTVEINEKSNGILEFNVNLKNLTPGLTRKL